MPFGHRLLQRIGVGRNAVLKIEQRIGVAVDFVLWRRRETDQERVEILEDRPVALIDRPMRLVDNDEIEMAGAEPGPSLLPAIDQAHHRRIGRDEDPAIAGLVGHQVHGR